MKRIMKSAFIATLLASVILAKAAPVLQSSVEYIVTDLGPKMEVSGINAHGEIAGTLITNSESTQAMIWRNGTWRRLGTFGGKKSVALGINENGNVVGFATTAEPDRNRIWEHGFLYEKGSMMDLGKSGIGLERALAINASGLVVGQTGYRKAWCYDGEKLTPLVALSTGGWESLSPAAINGAGEIVGQALVKTKDGTEKSHAFLFSRGKLVDLGTLGEDNSRADGISDGGWVVGSFRVKIDRADRHAFLFREGRMQDLGAPGGFESSEAKGINAHGIIVGDASTVTGGGFLRIDVDSRAYRYKDGQWTDLNSLVDLSGTKINRLLDAVAINDAGQIVGQGSGENFMHAFLLIPVASHGSR